MFYRCPGGRRHRRITINKWRLGSHKQTGTVTFIKG